MRCEMVRADISRLTENSRGAFRKLVAGLFSQGFQAIAVYRLFRWFYLRGIPTQPLRFIAERFIEITCGISIPVSANIGPGLRIHHFGGIVLHPSVVMGKGCTLYHGATIGDRGGTGNAARVGDNVMIGAGAKIIGEIEIGHNCRIGANSVVNRSMPAGSVAMGVPATIRSQQVPL